MSPRGVFGGTFDPVHLGHLRAAWEVSEALNMPIHMLVARVPPHRPQPLASAEQRWSMLRLALAGQDRLIADDRELKRPGPSYMFDTLQSLAKEFRGDSLCLILGSDAAAGLNRWHRWREVLERAHLLVLTRPGTPEAPLAALLDIREVHHPEALASRRSMALLRIPVTALEISASHIRGLCRTGRSARFLTPPAVHDYIQAQHVYADLADEL